MPRKNKRLEEALARVDAAVAEAEQERDDASTRYARSVARVDALLQTRAFLVEGGPK